MEASAERLGKADPVTGERTADLSDIHNWEPAEKFDDFALVCCGRPHLTLRTDPDSFSLTQRVGRMGPVTLSEFIVGPDVLSVIDAVVA